MEYLVCVLYALRSMSTKNIGKTTQMFVFASETKSMKHLIRSDMSLYSSAHCTIEQPRHIKSTCCLAITNIFPQIHHTTQMRVA